MANGQRGEAWDGGVYLKQSPSVDAFGRLRVANPTTLFESAAEYGDTPLFWETAVSGGGGVSNALNESSVLLSTGGTTSGAYAYRQTRTHFRYHPGKSLAIALTFVFDGGPVTENRRRIGYFDSQNGIFLELAGSTLSIVKRSYTTGSPIDTPVAQSAWNLDKLNGYGPSGLTLDVTKSQILFIDLQWLGAGLVRVGFEIGGKLIYAHQFEHANILNKVYMTTANLPIRAESYNTGVAGGTGVLRQICSTVYSEGGAAAHLGRQFSVNRGATALPINARRPVLSIRAKSTGPNGVSNTGQILPKETSVLAETNSVLYEIVLNGTLTGASWASVSAANSLTEYDVAATVIAGGTVISSGMVGAGGGGPFSVAGESQTGFFRDFPLVKTELGGIQDTLSLVLTPVTGTSDVWGAMTWQELL